MNKEASDIQKEIERILDESEEDQGMAWVLNHEKAVKEIYALILREKIELLKNFYYGEDLKDDDILHHYTQVLKLAKEEIENELKQLQ